MAGRVLIVEGDAEIRETLSRTLIDGDEHRVETADDGEAGLEALGTQPFDLVVADRSLPGADGAAWLGTVRTMFPEISCVLLVGEEAPDREEIREMAGEYLPTLSTPCRPREALKTVEEALALREADEEQIALVRQGGVSFRQYGRAQRIQQRMQKDRPIGEILLELGELTQEAYDRAVRARRTRLSIVRLLQADGKLDEKGYAEYLEARRQDPSRDDRDLLVGGELVTEEAFLRALCAKHDIPYVVPEIGSIDPKLLKKTSYRYLLKQHLLPVRLVDGRLLAILADPLDRDRFDEVERIFGVPLSISCCTRDKITEMLHTLEKLEGSPDGELALQYREIEHIADGDDEGEEAVQIIDYLFVRAIQIGASDLHIEPMQLKIRVRVRVDGVLQHLTDLPISFAPRVVSRVKVLAGLDITEKRLHQDGKICVKVEGREVDIRVSTYVSVFGETLVMRLLDRSRGVLPLDAIGFSPRVRSALADVVLEASSGLVMIVGPTGSGKTTLLYTFVEYANDPSEKVITCEDPVEYVMDGLVQCSCNQKTGPTFAQSLKAILRQDPDTIVVGEVRDKTTASLALEAALTGHKVFSTFHTEEAVGAFVRLLEMGVEPFLVASTISAVVAQRLVRRLCTHCRKPAELKRAELRFLGIDRSELEGAEMYDPGECAHCNGTGYKGRVAIHEVIMPGDDFRDAVIASSSSKELRKQARTLPEFLTMQEDGLLKVAEGTTSLSEIIANAPRDTSPRPLSVLQNIARIRRAS